MNLSGVKISVSSKVKEIQAKVWASSSGTLYVCIPKGSPIQKGDIVRVWQIPGTKVLGVEKL